MIDDMKTFFRYVRHLDSSMHAIQIKTKLCQLVEAVSSCACGLYLSTLFFAVVGLLFVSSMCVCVFHIHFVLFLTIIDEMFCGQDDVALEGFKQ